MSGKSIFKNVPSGKIKMLPLWMPFCKQAVLLTNMTSFLTLCDFVHNNAYYKISRIPKFAALLKLNSKIFFSVLYDD